MHAAPHYKARDAIVHVEHPDFDNIYMQNVFPKLSDTPGAVNWPGPPLGAHNREIYVDLLGKTTDDLAALAKAGTI